MGHNICVTSITRKNKGSGIAFRWLRHCRGNGVKSALDSSQDLMRQGLT
jgi:hypothetical protein